MKKLAIIKNELFKDYIKLVSTEDLESVLDNPDIPIPYECIQSIDNSNSDLLLEQLKQYFSSSKLKNKDFFALDENSSSQLNFMMNLIKISSTGQSVSSSVSQSSYINNNINKPSVSQNIESSVNNDTLVVEHQKEQVKEINHSLPKVADNIEIENTDTDFYEETPSFDDNQSFEDSNLDGLIDNSTVVSINEEVIIEESAQISSVNPFKKNPFKSAEKNVVDTEITPPERFNPTENVDVLNTEVTTENQVIEQEVIIENKDNLSVEIIESLGIPKKSTVYFIKSENITATLLDEKTVLFKGIEMSLTDAAKAAFKELNTVGMAVGLSNWLYDGKQLKTLKEEVLNK